MTLKRNRAQVKGGYRRVTVSVPNDVYASFEKYCEENPGLTMSAFLTDAGAAFLTTTKKRRNV
jgi:hypothetical protein